jgi:hypothetical protein
MSHPAMNAAQNNSIGSALGSVLTTGTSQGLWAPGQLMERSNPYQSSKTIFSGRVEVSKVANGYIVNIGRKEGYEYDTYIASTVQEVNEIIQAQLVAFRLEGK